MSSPTSSLGVKNLIDVLSSLWLSENESIVYLVILDNWKSLITDISKKCDIKRTSVINYVEELLKKWFLSKVIIWKRFAYIAENPENILKSFEIKKQKFEKFLPELNWMFLNSSKKARVRYFEWKSWIRKIYREISTQFKPIVTFYSLEKYLSVLTVTDMDEFMDNLSKYENTLSDLAEDTAFARDFLDSRYFNSKEVKWLPKTFPVDIDLLVWWDNVAMISFKKQMWVIIENKEIADFNRNLHKHFWELL